MRIAMIGMDHAALLTPDEMAEAGFIGRSIARPPSTFL